MIQWIALAMAADAECKAGRANAKSKRALHESKRGLEDHMIIVRPVDLDEVPAKETGSFWSQLIAGTKRVLSKEPWAVLSIRRSDIESLRGYEDDNGNPFVTLTISKYANVTRILPSDGEVRVTELEVPGTIEKITKILNGVK